jgi:Nickel responsive protein SCO4226-like
MRHSSLKARSTRAPELTAYLVEHYWPGITAEVFRAATERVQTIAEAMTRGGTPVRYLHSTMVPVDEAAFCVFATTSIELIELLYARAEVRFDRIVAALEV